MIPQQVYRDAHKHPFTSHSRGRGAPLVLGGSSVEFEGINFSLSSITLHQRKPINEMKTNIEPNLAMIYTAERTI